MVFIYSTFPNKKTARQAGERLVRKKLAACCNIFPIEAIYFWQGPEGKSSTSYGVKKIVRDKEFVMIIKTKKANFKKIEQFILENHPDDTPCILEIPINRVTKKYSSWLNKNLSK